MLESELDRLRIGRRERVRIGSPADRWADWVEVLEIGRTGTLEAELLIVLEELIGLEVSGDVREEERQGDGEEKKESEENCPATHDLRSGFSEIAGTRSREKKKIEEEKARQLCTNQGYRIRVCNLLNPIRY